MSCYFVVEGVLNWPRAACKNTATAAASDCLLLLLLLLLSMFSQNRDTLPTGSGLWDFEVRIATTTQQIGIPSYYYPCFTNTASCYWNRTSGNDATRLVIINPASGPGTAVDSNYVTTVNNMKAAGLIVLAYTYTSYGARAASAVQADIDK
jgi:hypothetical protein